MWIGRGSAAPARPAHRVGRAAAGLLLVLGVLAGLLVPSAQAAEKPPELDARAWILIDADDGERLAAQAPSRPLPIASATKLMTAYLALRELDLDEMVEAPPYQGVPAESVLGLQAGEMISARDLIVAMMLPSANDAAAALATEVSGSIPRFVVRMNGAARKLGLDDTSFANPIGLDDPLNRSSARDLAALAMELRADDRFRAIVAKSEATLRSGATTRKVSSRNSLLDADPSVDGIKTGQTRGAGYVLVGSAERDGVSLISVVLGASSEDARNSETSKLLDYGFSLYEPRRAVRRGEEVGAVPIESEDDDLPLLAAQGLEVTAREDQAISMRLLAPGSVEGPIERGDRIGRAVVAVDGERAGAVAALASRAVAEPGALDSLGGPLAVGLVAGGSMLLIVAAATGLRRSRTVSAPEPRTAQQRTSNRRRRSRSRGEGEEI